MPTTEELLAEIVKQYAKCLREADEIQSASLILTDYERNTFNCFVAQSMILTEVLDKFNLVILKGKDGNYEIGNAY